MWQELDIVPGHLEPTGLVLRCKSADSTMFSGCVAEYVDFGVARFPDDVAPREVVVNGEFDRFLEVFDVCFERAADVDVMVPLDLAALAVSVAVDLDSSCKGSQYFTVCCHMAGFSGEGEQLLFGDRFLVQNGLCEFDISQRLLLWDSAALLGDVVFDSEEDLDYCWDPVLGRFG